MSDMEELEIEDGSNDKAYFTMVPNIVLNHSSAVDQALYMQMKRFAGEKSGGGLCTASHRTLMEKLKIGPKALKTSLEYLTNHGWIQNVGARKVMTPGGPQDVQTYRVNDIWKMNLQHYKGAIERTPLSKGGDERKQGANERSKGGDESATTKNYIKHIEPSASEDGPRVVKEVPFKEEYEIEDSGVRTKKLTKYPNAKEVFSWFPCPEKSWALNTTELKHAELLFNRGEEEVKKRLRFVKNHEGEDYLPNITKPSDLERKWNDLSTYAKRNS